MVRGKSLGHLKFAGVNLPRDFSMFFNLCFSHLYLPQDSKRTIVVPILKDKTGDLSDKCNYRPIPQATVVAKVLDGVSHWPSSAHCGLGTSAIELGIAAKLSKMCT